MSYSWKTKSVAKNGLQAKWKIRGSCEIRPQRHWHTCEDSSRRKIAVEIRATVLSAETCWRERKKRSTKNAEFGNRVGASVHHVSYSNSFISKIDALPSKENSGSIFTVKSPRSPSFLVFFLTVEMMFACKTRYTHPCWLGKISGYFVFRWQSAKCKRTTWLWRGVLEFGWHPHKRCHFDSVKSLIPWRGHPAQQLHILATGLVLRSRSPKPGCFMPHSWYLWKALDK